MPIAITGGIAEGKSTVLAMLAEMGQRVASADAIAREVFDRPEINVRLADLLHEKGPVSRETLRAAIAVDPGLRRSVNALMHRPIYDELFGGGARFIEVPLLVETCLQGAFREVWVITCGEALQRTRLRERYGTTANVDAILATQLPTAIKTVFGDVIVRTNEPLDTVRTVLAEHLARIIGR